MDWLSLGREIIELCLIPLLIILTKYLVEWLKTKSKEIVENSDNALTIKYTNLLTETITSCVISTNQTYVDALKEIDAFDEKAQKEAFNRTFQAVMAILNDEAKKYLTEIYGDLTTYISNKIEAEVHFCKQSF